MRTRGPARCSGPRREPTPRRRPRRDSVTRQHGGRAARAHGRLAAGLDHRLIARRHPGGVGRAHVRDPAHGELPSPAHTGTTSPLASAASSSSCVNTSGDSIGLADMEQPYLAACTIYRDAASYLAEWIEFHRLVGVERFFLYDNGSVDDHREVLAPYVDAGHRRRARLADAVRRPARKRGAPCRVRSTIASAAHRERLLAGSHSSTSTSSCSHRPARRSRSCCASTRSTRPSA